MADTTDSIKLDYFGDTSNGSVDFKKKFSLEVKTPTGTQPIHLLIDWDDLLNRPVATFNTLGLVMPVYSNVNDVTIGKVGSGAASINERGIILQDRSNASDRFYAVEIDKSGRLYVNVPWEVSSIQSIRLIETFKKEDTNLTQTHGDKYNLYGQ